MWRSGTQHCGKGIGRTGTVYRQHISIYRTSANHTKANPMHIPMLYSISNIACILSPTNQIVRVHANVPFHSPHCMYTVAQPTTYIIQTYIHSIYYTYLCCILFHASSAAALLHQSVVRGPSEIECPEASRCSSWSRWDMVHSAQCTVHSVGATLDGALQHSKKKNKGGGGGMYTALTARRKMGCVVDKNNPLDQMDS